MDLEDTHQQIDGNEADAPRDVGLTPAGEAEQVNRAVESRDDEPKSLKDTLRNAVKEHETKPAAPEARRDRAPDGKFVAKVADEGRADPATAAPPADGEPAATEPPNANDESAPQLAAAPDSLSKEIRAKWPTLPEDVRNEFIRRETDGAKGVQQLKERYRSIDESLAPVRSLLQQRGISEGDAINQLFGWHQALSGPHKAEAAKALLQSHGIDPSTLAAGRPAAQHDDQSQQTQPQTLPPEFQQMQERFGSLEQQIQRDQNDRAARQIAEFAKDKPHFEAVKLRMGQLIQAGAATDLEDAYQQATWANPDVRAAMQQEVEEKRNAEARAAAEKQRAEDAKAEEERKRKEAEAAAKARKANVSPRGSTPGSTFAHAPRGKSVGGSIRDAVKELSGAV